MSRFSMGLEPPVLLMAVPRALALVELSVFVPTSRGLLAGQRHLGIGHVYIGSALLVEASNAVGGFAKSIGAGGAVGLGTGSIGVPTSQGQVGVRHIDVGAALLVEASVAVGGVTKGIGARGAVGVSTSTRCGLFARQGYLGIRHGHVGGVILTGRGLAAGIVGTVSTDGFRAASVSAGTANGGAFLTRVASDSIGAVQSRGISVRLIVRRGVRRLRKRRAGQANQTRA